MRRKKYGRKPSGYRHRRKRSVKGEIAKKIRRIKQKIKRKINKWWHEHRVRFLVISIGIMAVLILAIAHGCTRSAQRISEDGFTHDSRFSNSLILDGIDVSYAQGSVDWKAVKKAGVDFVFIRAGFTAGGTGKKYTDESFANNIQGAERAGLMTGVYYFSQATTTEEARKEADYLVDLAEDYQVDLPLVMDYELLEGGRLSAAYSKGMTAEQATSNALAFCSEVEKKGYDSMVYGNSSFLQNNLDPSVIGSNTHVWMAHYASATNYPFLYSVWQASDSAWVSGINHTVDRDFMYVDPDSGYRSYGDEKNRKSVSKCTVELGDRSSVYMGFNVEPGVKVYDGRKKLKEGKDYYLSYVKNTEPGTGYVVISGKGDYKDMSFSSFRIKGI